MSKVDLRFIPMTFSIENLKDEYGDMIVDIPAGGNFEDPVEMAPTDTFSESLKQIEANDLVVCILNHLDDREKIIFLYQLIRESGYDITHPELAETLHIGERVYFTHLKKMRDKVRLIHEHYFGPK